jgi:hypothetical protein
MQWETKYALSAHHDNEMHLLDAGAYANILESNLSHALARSPLSLLRCN